MAKTVVGLFDNFSDAKEVVDELERAGFQRDHISMVAHENAVGYREAESRDPGVGERVAHGVGDAVKGAVKGGVIGGLTGLAASLVVAMIPGIGPVLAAGPIAATLGGAGLGAAAGGIIGGLTGLGVPEEEAGYYSEGVRRGGTLVTAVVDDNRTDEAIAIFNRHNVVDIDERASYYQNTGYKGYDQSAKPYSAEDIARDRETYSTYATRSNTAAAGAGMATGAAAANAGTRTVKAGEEVRVPVIEEQVQVGKREVQGGGARIHTHVTERPVQEQVTLREERVTVEHNPVDRPVSQADMAGALQDRTIEVTERSEEAVVGKQARVVEEVVVGKEATQRTETINATARRTDVDVEELDEDNTVRTDATTTNRRV